MIKTADIGKIKVTKLDENKWSVDGHDDIYIGSNNGIPPFYSFFWYKISRGEEYMSMFAPKKLYEDYFTSPYNIPEDKGNRIINFLEADKRRIIEGII